MADEADQAQRYIDEEERIRRLNHPPYHLPEGKAGDCELCGEWSGRLIDGACAPCRDRYVNRDRRTV